MADDDIFQCVKDNRILNVRNWFDQQSPVDLDVNQGDNHQFSLLHYAAMKGHFAIADTLIQKGAKVNCINMGGDTPLHLASSFGHRELVQLLLSHNANVNMTNDHGNAPLHYACFFDHQSIAIDLVANGGAYLELQNRYDETPLSKARADLHSRLMEIAQSSYPELLVPCRYNQQRFNTIKTRTKDATLFRFPDVDEANVERKRLLHDGKFAKYEQALWQNNSVVIRTLKFRQTAPVTQRTRQEFKLQASRLRVFNNINILPVLALINSNQCLALIYPYMKHGSLYNVLHGYSSIEKTKSFAAKMASDIAKGMEFLHSFEPLIPNFYLSSKSVYIDEESSARSEFTAKVSLAKADFSFFDPSVRFDGVRWCSPEVLTNGLANVSQRAADVYSFGVICWEMITQQRPFNILIDDRAITPMELGIKIGLEKLRMDVKQLEVSAPHVAKVVAMCTNEEPGRRPAFVQLIGILEKILKHLNSVEGEAEPE